MAKKQPKCYMVNYYIWSNEKCKQIGVDEPLGFYTSLELAFEEIKRIVSLYPEQKLKKYDYWWTLITEDDKYFHYYEIIEWTMNVSKSDWAIRNRIKLSNL